MDVPETVQSFVFWLGRQFTVLAAVCVVVWWVLRWSNRQRAEELKRVDAAHAKLVAEKDKRIRELRARVKELQAKRTRKRNPGGASGTGDKGTQT